MYARKQLSCFCLCILVGLSLLTGGSLYAQCPSLKAIMVDPCNDDINNEFIIIHSGSGFNTRDLQISFDAANNIIGPENNDINVNLDNLPNTRACRFQPGNANLVLNCPNVRVVSQDEEIPPNAVVIIQMSGGANEAYDFSFLCGSGECVYVLQNDCVRSVEAFRNKASGSETLRIALRNTLCDEPTLYNRSLLDKGNGDFYAPDGNTLYGNRACNLATPPAAPPVGGATIPPDFVDPGPLSGCPSVTLPAITGSNLTGNQQYYTGPGGTGNFYPAGSKITRNLTLFIFDKTAPCSPEIPIRVTIIDPITPDLTIPTPVCENSGLVPLDTRQDGINGTWTGAGVTNNAFNTNINGQGIYVLTFTPNTGECALPNTTTIEVLPQPEPAQGVTGVACDALGINMAAFDLTLLNDDIRGGNPGQVRWYEDAAIQNQILDTFAYVTRPATIYAVWDNGACPSDPVAVDLTIGPGLEINFVNIKGLSCAGDADGAIEIEIVGGTPPFTITWSNPAYNGMTAISNLPAGSYGVTVSDAAGCWEAKTTGLVAPTEVDFSCQKVSDVSTVGGQDGSGSISISGGIPPYWIIWSGPVTDSVRLTSAATNYLLENLPAGNYQIIGRDALGCGSSCQFNIDLPNCGLQVTASSQEPTCADLANGRIQLTATGGQGAITYTWNPASLNGQSSASNLAAGLYEVSVSDAVGCLRTFTFDLQAPPALDLSCTSAAVPSSLGASDGEISLNFGGGTPPYSIIWTGPKGGSRNVGAAGNFLIDQLPAGNYNIVIRDDNGCEQNCVQNLPEGSCPGSLESQVTHESCPGSSDGSISLNLAGSWQAPVTIDWNVNQYDGQTQLNNLNPGNYTVTVTGANSCQASLTITVNAATGLPDVDFPATAEVCAYNCVTYPLQFSGTAPFFAEFILRVRNQNIPLNVSSDQTDASLVICPADYGVDTGSLRLQLIRVSDANCINDQGKESVLRLRQVVESVLSPTLCFGESIEVNGEIYDADRPGGTEILAGASQMGCDSIVRIDLKFHKLIREEIRQTLCPGESIRVNGQLYDENQPTGTEVLTSQEGCDSTVVINLSFFPEASGQLDLTLCPGEERVINGTVYNEQHPSGTEVFVGGSQHGCDSTLVVNIQFYPQVAGQYTETICPGSQTIINGNVYDENHLSGTEILPGLAQNGCDSLLEVNIRFYPEAIGVLNQTICPGEQITVNGTIYDENHPSGTEILLGASQHGCDSILQVQLDFFQLPVTVVTDMICPSEQRLINGTVYDINNPSGTEVIGGGAANGCDSIVQIDLQFFAPAVAILRDTLCSSGSMIVNNTVYDINRPTGIETLTGAAANGCDSLVEVELFFLEDITVSLTGDASICLLDSAELEWQISNTTEPLTITYAANDSIIGQITGVQDGDRLMVKPSVSTVYSIVEVVKPAGSCDIQIVGSAEVDIHQLFVDAVIISDYDGYGISCQGEYDGAIRIQVMEGQAPFQYFWEDGYRGQERTNLGPGVYSVRVVDAVGCEAEASVNLESPPPLKLDISVRSIDCTGGQSGGIIIDSISGGNREYFYSLNGAPALPVPQFPYIIGGLSAGRHTVVVSDEYGCSARRDAVIAEFAPLELLLSPGKTIKQGESVRLDADASFPIASFEWSASDTSTVINMLPTTVSPLKTTTYTLTVYDEQGCSTSGTVRIVVTRSSSVYLPTAFSPNHDGLNDRYYPFTDRNIKQIMEFRIFDRWGNLMHEMYNFQGNSEIFGWDGKFKNQLMDPAVFIYYLKAEYLDGHTEMFKGDFALVR